MTTHAPLTHRPVKLAIIGGGAAGMFAAAVAAERHIPCVVIERKARLGSKVLMTANGRCNFAKDISPDECLRDLGDGPCADFVAKAIRECPPRQICRGGHSRTASATNSAHGTSPKSRRNSSGEMSFAKLQRPFAVISTFEPSRALRSITTQGICRSAATAAANIPAAPPPMMASFTGLCVSGA